MSITAGVLSQVSVASTTANLLATAATGGTGPYTYQWYQSTTTGFTVGVGNLVAGATALSQAFSGLTPNTQYYYKVVATDTGHSNDTVEYTQLAVATTVPVLSPNQFSQTPFLGVVDLPYNYNTVAVQVDVSQSGPLYGGTAVKRVTSNTARGIPAVVACTSATDEVMGFINFDIKSQSFVAGSRAEISMAGNVIYLYATGAIVPGTQVTLDLATNGGVKQVTGSSANNIVGWAYDAATAAGQLIRVRVSTPSFSFDS